MYPSSGAVIRGDVNIKVEEAAQADTFFIADKVFPPFEVAARSGQYPKLQTAAAELLSAGSVNRGTDGSYGEVSRAYTYDTYDTQDRGLEERVDDADQADLARFFNLEATAAKLCMRNMKMSAEARVAAATMNASTFADYTAGAVNYTYTLIATCNFPLDVLAAISRVNSNGGQANTIVMSHTLFNYVRRTTLTKDWVAGSVGPTANVTASTLANSFADNGIEQVLIGKANYNAAKKGQTKSMSEVWGTTYIWVGQVNRNATTMEEGGCGYQLVWNAEGGLYVTESYRDESRRSNMIRVRQNSIEKVVDATAGTLITTSYSAT